MVPIGTTLKLRKDSTYYYQSCGNIITGYWRVIDDSLCLFDETNRWRTDSINNLGIQGRPPRLGQVPDKYGIGRNKLSKSWYQDVDGKEFKMVSILQK